MSTGKGENTSFDETMHMLTMLAPQTLLCLACLALGSTETSFRAHRAHLKPLRFGQSAEAIFASCQTFHSSHLRQQSREMLPSPPVSLGLPHLPGIHYAALCEWKTEKSPAGKPQWGEDAPEIIPDAYT